MIAPEIVDNELLKEQAERKPREGSGKFKPSNLGRCYRLQVLARLNIPISNPPDLRGLKNIAQGVATHKLNQRYLPEDMCEVKIETEHFLGYADIEEENAICDIKSSEEWQIKKFWYKPVEVLVKEKYTAWLQTGWYALKRNKPYTTILPTPYGNFIKKSYSVLTESLREDIEKEESTLIKFWEDKIIPCADPRAFKGKECTYCSFKDTCDTFSKEAFTIEVLNEYKQST